MFQKNVISISFSLFSNEKIFYECNLVSDSKPILHKLSLNICKRFKFDKKECEGNQDLSTFYDEVWLGWIFEPPASDWW